MMENPRKTSRDHVNTNELQTNHNGIPCGNCTLVIKPGTMSLQFAFSFLMSGEL